MSKKIEEFYLLVHPDWNAYRGSYPELNHQEKQLRALWDQSVEVIARNPSAILFYYSSFNFENKDPQTFQPATELGKAEMDRRQRYGHLLGDRYFLFNDPAIPDPVLYYQTLKSRDFSYYSPTSKLFAFGEYLNQCVWVWRNQAQRALNIPESNRFSLSSLSLVCPNYSSRYSKDDNTPIKLETAAFTRLTNPLISV